MLIIIIIFTQILNIQINIAPFLKVKSKNFYFNINYFESLREREVNFQEFDFWLGNLMYDQEENNSSKQHMLSFNSMKNI
ncbi:unnamed protein product [Paramecium primaurelia]|uniref:Uncharacterized protein n=1 Tax=Paramecium primaurelia TaxID=5886 RepID=A0A8S1PSG5_PARPR|nr:unnamed protein product [Paramecium primaurelia]